MNRKTNRFATYLTLAALALGVSSRAESQVRWNVPNSPAVQGLPYILTSPLTVDIYLAPPDYDVGTPNPVAEAFANAGISPETDDDGVIYISFPHLAYNHRNFVSVNEQGLPQVCAEDRCYHPNKGLEMLMEDDLERATRILNRSETSEDIVYLFDTPFTPEEEHLRRQHSRADLKKILSFGGVHVEGPRLNRRIIGFSEENVGLDGSHSSAERYRRALYEAATEDIGLSAHDYLIGTGAYDNLILQHYQPPMVLPLTVLAP